MPNLQHRNLEYTFFGDVLGVSNYYRISPDAAYERLNFFYNKSFELLKPLLDIDKQCNIFLFSDSLFITGKKHEEAFKHIAFLYSTLFQRRILLRGAMVGGLLTFQPRIEVSRLVKQLPQGDVLFRAVDLEKRGKGSRLLLENKLAHKILPKEWYTCGSCNYIDDANVSRITTDNIHIARNIRLTPDWNSYEYLWPLIQDREYPNGNKVKLAYSEVQLILNEIKSESPREATIHINETMKMMQSIKFELQYNYHHNYNKAMSAYVEKYKRIVHR